MTDQDLLSMKLHIGPEGTVWYCLADGAPLNSSMPPLKFMMSSLCGLSNLVRIIGLDHNIPLILGLYGLKKTVQVCSPAACATEYERYEPVLAMYAARKYDKAPSLGGWHTFGPQDHAAYALASYMMKTRAFDSVAEKLLHAHPAWPALSFISYLKPAPCAGLLTAILDPRWYIDPQHPSRSSRLRKYLGITPQNVKALVEDSPKQAFKQPLCSLALSCWMGVKDTAQIELPDHFIYRIFRTVAAHDTSKAVLRAAHKFIDFLRLTWMDAIHRSKQSDPLFIPKYFFRTSDETQAFEQHMTNLSLNE